MGPSPLQLCMDYGDYSQDQREMKMPPSMADMMGCSASSPAAFLGAAAERKPKPQPEQALKCPRCNSNNTKFCYYNNYSLSQPRYFCKTCRRYWTQGGALRNVPVGGGCRKNKKSSTSSSSSTPKKPSSDTPPGLAAADMGAPACFGFAPMGPPVCTDGFSPAPDIFGLGRPGYDGHHIIPGFSSENSACSSSSGSQNLASLLASMHANSRTISPPASASDLLWRLQGRPKFDSPAPAPGMMLRFHENRDEGLTTAQFITDPKASSSSSSMLNPRFGFCDGYEGGPPASAVKSETAAWHGDVSAAAAAAAAAASEISPSKESIFCNDKSSSSAAAAAAAALPFLYSCHSSSVSSLM